VIVKMVTMGSIVSHGTALVLYTTQVVYVLETELVWHQMYVLVGTVTLDKHAKIIIAAVCYSIRVVFALQMVLV